MKKIITLFLASFILVSCTNKTETQEEVQNTEKTTTEQVIQTPSESLTEGENEDLKKYLEDYEQTLREDGSFSEEVIQEALRIKREEWINSIVKR